LALVLPINHNLIVIITDYHNDYDNYNENKNATNTYIEFDVN